MDIIFDKYLTITTNDNTTIYIEKKPIYINDSSEYYGEKYIITSDKLNKKSLYVLREIYSFDNNRLRYSYEKYNDIKIFDTIEKIDNGTEKKITVLEHYNNKESLIGSIGNINDLESDKIIQKEKKNNKVLKLLRSPKKQRDKKLVA